MCHSVERFRQKRSTQETIGAHSRKRNAMSESRSTQLTRKVVKHISRRGTKRIHPLQDALVNN